MTAGRSDHRQVRIRRRGRHAAPSQVEKVAQQAGKAAPAVALAGAIVAVPQLPAFAASAATISVSAQGQHTAQVHQAQGPAVSTSTQDTAAMLDSVATHAVTVSSAAKARHAAAATSTYYKVRSGDSLSTIAERYYHKAADWQWVYHENEKTVSDPDLIFVNEKLFIPGSAPANYTLPGYVPRHSKATVAVTTAATTATPVSYSSASTGSGSSTGGGGAASGGGSGSGSGSSGGGSGTIGGSSDGGTVVVQSAPVGSYSCPALESLWDQAGGNAADAFTAAEIAIAESGGNPNAISPTDDYGLWQINASNGALATLNPLANAKSAIILSDDGANWDAWTTYRTGAYYGRC